MDKIESSGISEFRQIVAYRLLITGSRQASPAMLLMAHNAVLRAASNKWQIVVGDAEGVDQRVQLSCCEQDIPFAVFGVTQYPRHICCDKHIEHYAKVDGDYLDRDRLMVGLADRVFAIWNGKSRGTKYTYDWAIKMGLPADIRIFGK